MSDPSTRPPEQHQLPSAETNTTFAQQFTYTEVANLKRVGVKTVMAWVRKGMIPSPVYTGFTARFTQDQVAEIMCGISAAGTHTVAKSPRRKVGKLGGNPNVIAPKKKKKVTAKKVTAKKVTAKRAKK